MKTVAFLLSLLISASAFAQSGVRQNGAVTNFDITRWRQDHVVDDPNNDTTTGRGVNPFHIYDQNACGITLDNKLITDAANNPLCLGHNSSGAAIATYQGNTYPFPFAASGVNGPNPTVNKALPFWSGTSGTLLGDSAFVFLTPEMYGAKGDCATNDSAATQAAINDAQLTGATLWFGPKCYLVTDLLVNQPMWLHGASWSKTILKNPTVGATSNILKIGFNAPNLAQSIGIKITDMAFSGNSPNGGYAIAMHNVAYITVRDVYLDQVFCGIEVETANTVSLENITGYTRGTNCEAVKFWASPTSLAAGRRSDQLFMHNVGVNMQYYGNDGFHWEGMAATVNSINAVFLQAKRGLWVSAAQNTPSVFPAFASFYNLQVEGGQTAACEIDGGRYMYFTDGFCVSAYGGSGPGGSQGSNDVAALAIYPDYTNSVTSDIQFENMQIGISAHVGIYAQLQNFKLSNITMRGSSLKVALADPSISISGTPATGSADYMFNNVKFCGTFGDTVQNNYGLAIGDPVGNILLSNSNFNYCQTGEVTSTDTLFQLYTSNNMDRNGARLPDSAGSFIDNTVPAASACGAAGGGPVVAGNDLIGRVTTVADTGMTCHIDFANVIRSPAGGGPESVLVTSNNPAIPVAAVNVTSTGFDITSSAAITSAIVFWRISQGTN